MASILRLQPNSKTMTYQLTTGDIILRSADNAFIPFDPANIDYQAYLAWVAAGNTPLPADQPE